MANARFRALPIYVKSKKVAELQGCDVEYDSNDEAQESTEGYLGHSEGCTMSAITCDTIVPVGGSSVDALKMIKNKEDVNIGAPLEGKFVQATMRCTKYSAKSTAKNGTTKGNFRFEGGDLDGI